MLLDAGVAVVCDALGMVVDNNGVVARVLGARVVGIVAIVARDVFGVAVTIEDVLVRDTFGVVVILILGVVDVL